MQVWLNGESKLPAGAYVSVNSGLSLYAGPVIDRQPVLDVPHVHQISAVMRSSPHGAPYGYGLCMDGWMDVAP